MNRTRDDVLGFLKWFKHRPTKPATPLPKLERNLKDTLKDGRGRLVRETLDQLEAAEYARGASHVTVAKSNN